MKKLFQAVDIIKWAKKITASTVIVSLLMIDAAKAMEEEYDPRLSKVVRSPLSLKFPPTDQETTIEIIDDFSSRQNSSLDEADSSTGSISASPEKLTPEKDKSLVLSPLSTLSLVFPQSNDVSISQQPDTIKSQPSSLPSDPLAEESYPQLQLSSSISTSIGNSIGTSPMRAASLQERSPPFIPSSQSVTESSHNNGQPASSFPNYILVPANYDPLAGSDSEVDSAEDADIFFLGTQPNIPRSPSVRIVGSKRNLFSAPATVFFEQLPYNESSRLLDPALKPRYFSIQADDRRDDPSPSIPLGDPEDHNLPAIEENDSRCCSWCPDRPLWPEPTKCTLPDPLNEIQKRSDFFLSPRPNHAVSSSDESNESLSLEESDSSSPHGSPPKASAGILPSTDGDSDDPEVAFGNPTHLAITDDESLINLQSPVDGPIGAPLGAPVPPTHLSIFPDHDLERGDLTATAATSHAGPLTPREAWLQILDDLKDLSPAAKAQLTDFTHQILNDKSTWAQRLGKWVIGPLIGAGFAWAMGPVYDGGLTYLANISEGFSSKFLETNASNYLVLYISYSAFPDGISRNAHLWKKGIAYLFQEKKEMGRICIAGAIAAVTALIPVAYLILAENIPRERFQLPNWDNVFGRAVVTWGPFLYLDDLVKVVDITMKSIFNLEDWFRQFRQVFFPSSLTSQIRSSEAIQREKFDHDLIKLKHFLAGASNTVIEAIYQDVQDVIAGARSKEDLGAQQAFATVSYLLSLGDEVQELTKKNAKKSIAEIAFDGLKYTCLILGAPTVALLLQLVGSTVASLFTSNMVADPIGEGFALVAFLPFNYVLVQSMDNFKNLLMSRDPQGYESHPAVRLPVKVFIGIQSFVYLFQTSIAVLQSYQKWFGDQWWPFAAGIPFFIPKFMGLACSFNETFNEQVTTSAINISHRMGGKCRGDSLCPPCQKDRLIQFIESSRNDLEHWSPELIHNLTKGVEIFKDEESNFSFDEI
jgi:hypothetical protein